MADARTAFLISIDDEHEGGYQNNPNDRANWTGGHVGVGTLVGTKYGITCLDLPGVSIKDLTTDQALSFYMEGYWKPLYSQISDQAMANKLADMGILFGVGTAIEVLERVLRLPVDGVFGPNDLAMTNNGGIILLSSYKGQLHAHAVAVAAANANDAEFLKGWNTRIDS